MKTKVFRIFSKDFLFGIYLTIYDSDKCFCDSIQNDTGNCFGFTIVFLLTKHGFWDTIKDVALCKFVLYLLIPKRNCVYENFAGQPVLLS